jgi:hypothetical protein
MDFLFYVPFFCTAAAEVTEILNICFVNVEFFDRKKLKVKRASHFVKIIVACPHRLPKQPESTQRKQAIPNKGSLFYSHCAKNQEPRTIFEALSCLANLFSFSWRADFQSL